MKQTQPSAEASEYHYVECGLPNVWLRNGFEKKQTPYGEGVSISDIEGLHRCISRTLCDKPGQLIRTGIQIPATRTGFFPKDDR